MSDDSPHRNTYTIGALRKALAVLDCFSQRDSWSLSELRTELGLHKATVYRILHTFEDFGYLTRDADGKYRLGMRLFALGNRATSGESLRWQSLPPLQDLAQETGETVYIGILYEGWAVCVQVMDGTHEVRMHSFVGKRSPAHASALGKTLLAHLPDGEVDAFIERYGLKGFTPNTKSDADAFKTELRRIREQGFAVDDEEMEIGLRCLGAPIYDASGRAVATVAISGPANRMSLERIEALVPLIKAKSRHISRMLGSPSPYTGSLVEA